MKRTIIILLLITSINSVAQVKPVEIWQRSVANEVLQAVYGPDSTINIQMTGMDEASDNSTKDMTIFSGTPKEYYSFICNLENFADQNKPEGNLRIGANINGVSVYVEKFLGGVKLWIENGSSSYHHLPPSLLPKVKEKFIEWANKNNVPYQ